MSVHPLDRHPALGEEGADPEQERAGGLAPFVGMDLHVGDPGVIVHAGVQEVVADPAFALGPPGGGGTSQHPVTSAVGDPPQLLHVDVQELPGSGAFVAQGNPGRAVQVAEAGQAVAAEHCVDG